MFYYIYQLYIPINNTHHIFHTNYLEDVSNEDDIRDEIISKIDYNTPLNKFLKELMLDFEIKIIEKVSTTDRIREKVKGYIEESGQHFASYYVKQIKDYQQQNKKKYSEYNKRYWADPNKRPHLRKFNAKYKPHVTWDYSLGYWDYGKADD